MKILTGVAVVPVAEGKRISYSYSILNDSGQIQSANNRGSFLAAGDEVLAAIALLENAAQTALEAQS